MPGKTKARLRAFITTLLELAGAALITAGVTFIYQPAGYIVGGVCLIGISYLIVRGGVRR